MFVDTWIRAILPKSPQFFGLLNRLAVKLEEAAARFVALADCNPADYHSIAAGMRIVEHEADEVAHELYVELDRTFVTPIDREDLAHLTSAIDNVIDALEHAAAFVTIYHTPLLTDPMKELVKISHEACLEVAAVVKKLPKLHNSELIKPHVIAVNTLENRADVVYRKALEGVFANPPAAVDLVRYRDLLNALEVSVDACEDVMDVVQSVTIKNG